MRKKDILMIMAAVLVVLGVAAGIFFYRSEAAVSWGLRFRQEGEQPSGTAEAARLRKWDAWYLAPTREKVICLTFDAGYENGCTEKILDTLKKQEVKAAFFLVGSYIEKNGDLVRRMVQEGHTVGNHTMDHPNMGEITDPEAFKKQLAGVEEAFREKTGQELPKFYRPPQGIYSENNLEMAKKLGYKTLFWSLAYVDWKNDAQPTREQALEKLLPRIHPGAVVLLHSTSQTNADILDEVITRWKEMGYRFVTPEELTAMG